VLLRAWANFSDCGFSRRVFLFRQEFSFSQSYRFCPSFCQALAEDRVTTPTKKKRLRQAGQTCINIVKHVSLHLHARTHACTHAHTYTHTITHTQKHIHAHARTAHVRYTYRRTDILTLTHTRTHIYSPAHKNKKRKKS
jgi:hypothetical protein